MAATRRMCFIEKKIRFASRGHHWQPYFMLWKFNQNFCRFTIFEIGLQVVTENSAAITIEKLLSVNKKSNNLTSSIIKIKQSFAGVIAMSQYLRKKVYFFLLLN